MTIGEWPNRKNIESLNLTRKVNILRLWLGKEYWVTWFDTKIKSFKALTWKLAFWSKVHDLSQRFEERVIYSWWKYYCYHQNTKQLWCHPIIQISNIVIAIGISSLLLFWWLSLELSLLKAIAKRLPLLFAFKCVKKWQLLLSQ